MFDQKLKLNLNVIRSSIQLTAIVLVFSFIQLRANAFASSMLRHFICHFINNVVPLELGYIYDAKRFFMLFLKTDFFSL